MNSAIKTLSSAHLLLRTKGYLRRQVVVTIEISTSKNYRTAFCSNYWNL